MVRKATQNLLALDLGATKLAVRLGDGRGKPTDFVFPLSRSGDGHEEVRNALDQIDNVLGGIHINACGLASAPTLDATGQVTRWPSRPHWVGVPLIDALQDVVGCAVDVIDDGNAAALAEAQCVHDGGLVYLGLGTGVGGGIVVAGSLLDSANGFGSELGHILVDRYGPRCECGRCGCLQAYASATAILRSGGDGLGGATRLQRLRERYLNGDCRAVTALERASWALAQTVVSLSEILGIGVVVIGGSVGDCLPEIVPAVSKCINSLLRTGQRAIEVRQATHGALSSLAGAEVLARQRLVGARAQVVSY